VAFDASASTDADGTVARYNWNFGDGTTARNAGPRPVHVYAVAGRFRASVQVIDAEGCSTRRVYTGQTALCNGRAAARAAVPIVITAPPDTTPPRLRLGGATNQFNGPTVSVSASCDEACTTRATGTLLVTTPAARPGGQPQTHRYTLGPTQAKLAKSVPRTLRLSVPRGARLLLAHSGTHGVATIRAVAKDAAGNAAHSTRKITLHRRS
jgi:hypothetical protein